MEISFKKTPGSRAEILFSLKKEEFGKFKERAISKLGQNFKKEGFRPGKAPKEVMEKEIGDIQILEEAVKILFEDNYLKIISENKVSPLSQPEIEVLKPASPEDDFLKFKVSFSIFPEVKLPDYKNIVSKIKRNKITVEEREIDDALRWIQKSRAKLTLKSQPAGKGDFIEITFSSPQIEAGLERKDSFILGEGQLVQGFEENLFGMTNSQEKEFSLTFPQDYPQKEMAGKNFQFKVKVHTVQKAEFPEINDDFAKGLGSFNDLASLKKSIREGVLIEKEITEGQRVRQEILSKLGEASEIEIPELLIEREKDVMLDRMKAKISEVLKVNFEEYITKIKKTEKEIKDTFSEEAKTRAKYDLILREISIRERIDTTPEEIKEEVNKILNNFPIDKAKELDLQNLKLYIENEIKKEKTLKFLESLSKYL